MKSHYKTNLQLLFLMVIAPAGFSASYFGGEYDNMTTFKWIVLIAIILIFSLSTFYNIMIYLKVPYIEITDKEIVRRSVFGGFKTYDFSYKFDYKHKNGRLVWINILDKDGNLIDLIGDVHKAPLIEIRDEIEKKRLNN